MADKYLTRDEFNELIDLAISRAIKEATDKTDRKYGVFTDEDAKEASEGKTSPEDKARRFEKFIKGLIAGDVDVEEMKALGTTTDADGGYLVPEEYIPDIITAAANYGIARRYCTIVPMKTATAKVPTALVDTIPTYWVNEASAIGSSGQNLFGQVQLSAKKHGVIVPMTEELVEDAITNVGQLIIDLIGRSLAYGEDMQVFRGTGSPFTGVLNASGVNAVQMATGKTDFSDIDADVLSDAEAAVESKYKRGAPRWFFHDNIAAYLRVVKDANGQYIMQSPVGNSFGSIWGVPYELTDVMPGAGDSAPDTAFVLYGDLRYVLLGDRSNISIKVLTEATIKDVDNSTDINLGMLDMRAIRVRERVAVAVAVPEAFAVVKTAAS